jgi:hypothetical protein
MDKVTGFLKYKRIPGASRSVGLPAYTSTPQEATWAR